MINEKRDWNNDPYYICFRLGDITHETNLAHFSKLVQLPVGGTAIFVHVDHSQSDF